MILKFGTYDVDYLTCETWMHLMIMTIIWSFSESVSILLFSYYR